jgi:GMP synthase (glutamine-hydrolysing)
VKRIVIVKTGATLPHLARERGDYEDWIAEGIGRAGQTEVVRAQDGDALPDPASVAATVITGSSAYVTDRLDWSERIASWLPEALQHGAFVLGICYGHQLLAQALGGKVEMNDRGREIGTIDVALTPDGTRDPLLGSLGETLRVNASHRQSVVRLPDGARLLAHNAKDDHQAFAIGERAWGVQFHPEWDHDIVRAYIEDRVAILREEGLDPSELLARLAPSTHGRTILERFGAMIE